MLDTSTVAWFHMVSTPTTVTACCGCEGNWAPPWHGSRSWRVSSERWHTFVMGLLKRWLSGGWNWRSPSFISFFRGVGWNHQPVCHLWALKDGYGGFPAPYDESLIVVERPYLLRLIFSVYWRFPNSHILISALVLKFSMLLLKVPLFVF
jgi:hypothetical protein